MSLIDSTKALARLSWAMSLLGLKQTTSLADPRQLSPGANAPPGSPNLDEVTNAAVEQFGQNLKVMFDAGEKVQTEIFNAMAGMLGALPLTAPGMPLPGNFSSGLFNPSSMFPSADRGSLPILDAKSGANEEIVISFTRGHGQFSEDRRFITLDNKIYLLDGREFGVHQGVWAREFETPQDLMRKPNPPSPPLNEPLGPVEKGLIAAATKAVWAFQDGAIYSVGPAASHEFVFQHDAFVAFVRSAEGLERRANRFGKFVPRSIRL